jgi:hypothetical protein
MKPIHVTHHLRDQQVNPMKTLVRLSVLLTLVFSNAPHLLGDVRVAGIFADHMVLQRDRPIPVWGWADKGSEVTVVFAEQVATSTAGYDGTWSVTLKPLVASAEGKELRVQSNDQKITIRDVVVGEIWHASGQSNMAMTVGSMARELESVKSDIAAADLPATRFCRVNELADKGGNWWPAEAEIDGRTVVVRSDKVQVPVAVRYAYAVAPENCSLYNRDGLPASPFCTKPELLQYDPGLPR